MSLDADGTPQGPWIAGSGPDCDVVLSCRVRVARNLAGFPFVNRLSTAQRHEVMHQTRSAVMDAPLDGKLVWIPLEGAPMRDRRLLVERHLISKQLADGKGERAAAISQDESLSIMVNEEDHLRTQVLAGGNQLNSVFERLYRLDDQLEDRLDFAFDSRWGYLTACPTNIGTGIRLSVMMHLPALRLTGEVDKLRRAAKDLNLAVRGYYGEGSDASGDFYQVSNQVTFGRSEPELLEEFEHRIIPRMIGYERRARTALMESDRVQVEDRVHRSLAILRHARLLKVDEAMRHLSRIRLGLHLDMLDDSVDLEQINRLFLQVQPAHLRFLSPGLIERGDARAHRASMVREMLTS